MAVLNKKHIAKYTVNTTGAIVVPVFHLQQLKTVGVIDMATNEQPQGILTLQTLSMPADTNPMGDIFGGWLLSQMDIAGAILAIETAHGRVATVAVSSMKFLRPVPVGSVVSCYSVLRAIGHTSIRVGIEVWIKDFKTDHRLKVTEGEFVYVAIDEAGIKRPVNA